MTLHNSMSLVLEEFQEAETKLAFTPDDQERLLSIMTRAEKNKEFVSQVKKKELKKKATNAVVFDQ